MKPEKAESISLADLDPEVVDNPKLRAAIERVMERATEASTGSRYDRHSMTSTTKAERARAADDK